MCVQKSCMQKLAVLSIQDNQIIRLSARSPNNVLSGCRIVPKDELSTTKQPQTTKMPEHNINIVPTSITDFDKFIKPSTTPTPKSGRQSTDENISIDLSEADEMQHSLETFNFTTFNDTDTFNASAITADTKAHNGGGLQMKNDILLENKLENGSDFKKDVEQLFEMTEKTRSARQSFPTFLHGNPREKLIVRCHNAGKFFSARQRWWYIAVSNCGSDKGLDIRYKFRMTNGATGEFWSEHYSADEMCKKIYTKLKWNFI